MTVGLLFVTAPEADHKLINRALLYLRDIQYGDGHDPFRLLTSRNPHDRSIPLDEFQVASTSPPVPADLANAWAGASLADVESHVLAMHAAGYTGLSTTLFVVLDSAGAADQTFVLGENHYDPDTEDFSGRFDKARVPWAETYISWCNLDIANIGWDELMDGGEAGEPGGWWVFRSLSGGDRDTSAEDQRVREAEEKGDERAATMARGSRNAKINRRKAEDEAWAKRDAQIKELEEEGKA